MRIKVKNQDIGQWASLQAGQNDAAHFTERLGGMEEPTQA